MIQAVNQTGPAAKQKMVCIITSMTFYLPRQFINAQCYWVKNLFSYCDDLKKNDVSIIREREFHEEQFKNICSKFDNDREKHKTFIATLTGSVLKNKRNWNHNKII